MCNDGGAISVPQEIESAAAGITLPAHGHGFARAESLTLPEASSHRGADPLTGAGNGCTIGSGWSIVGRSVIACCDGGGCGLCYRGGGGSGGCSAIPNGVPVALPAQPAGRCEFCAPPAIIMQPSPRCALTCVRMCQFIRSFL